MVAIPVLSSLAKGDFACGVGTDCDPGVDIFGEGTGDGISVGEGVCGIT
jgi:hypothetical protein